MVPRDQRLRGPNRYAVIYPEILWKTCLLVIGKPSEIASGLVFDVIAKKIGNEIFNVP